MSHVNIETFDLAKVQAGRKAFLNVGNAVFPVVVTAIPGKDYVIAEGDQIEPAVFNLNGSRRGSRAQGILVMEAEQPKVYFLVWSRGPDGKIKPEVNRFESANSSEEVKKRYAAIGFTVEKVEVIHFK